MSNFDAIRPTRPTKTAFVSREGGAFGGTYYADATSLDVRFSKGGYAEKEARYDTKTADQNVCLAPSN